MFQLVLFIYEIFCLKLIINNSPMSIQFYFSDKMNQNDLEWL